ncbi:MAG: hypothetical protein ABIL06_13335 [Pseudomonadota bacterium]|uniref:Uncharacterized protein n=1 Tax=viral metagenome TaxID=1070528 RepID=A0A6M3J3V2_9ZZZZ
MGTKKISAMTELTTPALADYLLILDSSASEDKKIKFQNAIIGATTYSMTAAQTSLTIGTELKASPIEVVFLGASAAESLNMINGSNDGHIKVIVASNANVTIVRNDAYIKLNQPTANPNFAMSTGDILALVNEDGNPDTPANGTWKELFRSIQL